MPKFCSVEGCDRTDIYARGMCIKHYKAAWKRAYPFGKNPKPCSVMGCKSFACTKGMCKRHYLRWHRRGDTALKVNICGLAKKYPEEHAVWASMKARCSNPNIPAYKHYGGRGIKVCERWLGTYGFQNFMQDMGPRPKGKHGGKSKYTLDRINVNGDYSPENCKWRDWYDQATNKRSRPSAVGVRKQGRRWEARITVLGKEYREVCDSKEGAVLARRELERKYRWSIS